MLGAGMNANGRHKRTTEVIQDALDGIDGGTVEIGALVDRFERRGFGVLVLLLTLPAFIPVPGVGALTGPVIALLGLQLMVGRTHPWLPARVRRKSLRKESFARFIGRMGRVLRVLERFCRPRALWLFDNAGNRASGLMLVFYGALLSLPIPFTNYLFALVLLAIAIAMIERDGVLLISSWFVVGPLILALGVAWRNLKAGHLRRRRRNGRHAGNCNGHGNGEGPAGG